MARQSAVHFPSTCLRPNYTRAVNIRNPRVEALLDEVADLTGEGTTEAGRRALEERRERLRATMGAEFPRTDCPLA